MTLVDEKTAKELNWQMRSNLIKDVAQAISYLHHDCNPPIIHRDITSNNILLDRSFKAYVSDFGTARILKPDSSNWSALAGTFGYIAPGNIPFLTLEILQYHNGDPDSSLLVQSSHTHLL